MLVTDIIRTNKKGEEKIGFYMDGYLKRNLDGVPAFLKKEWDVVGIVSGHGKVGTGKTLKIGSRVLMSDGSWKNVENIKIGDEVISPGIDNSYTTNEKVIEIHNRFEKDCYDIIEEKKGKLLYSCAGNHDIPVFKLNTRKNKYEYQIIEARELNKFSKKNRNMFYCFSSPAVEFKSIEPTIDPYCLGAWIGDGHFSNDIGITSEDLEIINEFKKNYEIMSKWRKKDSNTFTYRLSIKNDFSKELIKYGYKYTSSGKKFIPKECLLASIDFRFNLLAGLIDTDGHASKRDNSIEYTTKSERLSIDIKNLVFSLGGNAKITKIKKSIKRLNFTGNYFLIRISFSNPTIIPLRLSRKKKNLKPTVYNRQKVYIQSVKSSSSKVFGFEISGKSKLHITDNWMVTHNSTMAQNVGYYLAWLLAGGEMIDEEYEKGKFRTKDIVKPKKPVRFSMENIVFTPEDLMKKAEMLYKKHGPNQVLVYDEGMSGLDSANAMMSINKAMVEFMQRCRVYHHIILIVLPNFFKLHEDYAVARSLFLIDCYADKEFNRGYFSFYNEYQKEKLYYFGKRLIGVRARYAAAHDSFWGRFTKWMPVDKDEYDKAKITAIENVSKQGYNKKYKIQRDAAIYLTKKTRIYSSKEISEELTKICNQKVSERTIQRSIESISILKDLEED